MPKGKFWNFWAEPTKLPKYPGHASENYETFHIFYDIHKGSTVKISDQPDRIWLVQLYKYQSNLKLIQKHTN